MCVKIAPKYNTVLVYNQHLKLLNQCQKRERRIGHPNKLIDCNQSFLFFYVSSKLEHTSKSRHFTMPTFTDSEVTMKHKNRLKFELKTFFKESGVHQNKLDNYQTNYFIKEIIGLQ